MLKEYAARLQIQSVSKDGVWYVWLSNIKVVLEYRLLSLLKAEKIFLENEFDDRIFLVFLGDKGGRSTKCAIGIGNMSQANSAHSLLLVSIFDDDDNYSNLASLKQVLDQLKFDEIKVGEEVKRVTWYTFMHYIYFFHLIN